MSYQQPSPPAGAKPSNNLVFAILSTLLCCLPAGVVSIVYAAQVDGKWNAGDYAGAQQASDNAKRWAIISAVIGLIVLVLYVVLIVVIGVNSDDNTIN